MRTTLRRALGVALLLAVLPMGLGAPAWAGGDPVERLRSVQVTRAAADYAEDRAELVGDLAMLSPTELERLAAHPDWRVRHQAQVVSLWRTDRELARQMEALPPRSTRGGLLVFADPAMDRPGATTLLADRLAHGGESTEVRVALAQAVARDPGSDLGVVMGLFSAEPEGQVRAALISGLRRHPDQAAAVAGLRQGMADPSAAVRAEAAGSAGYREGGEALGPDLIRLLTDPEAEVRGLAARSLGWLHVDAAFEPLLGLLDDPSGEVRLQALRALERVDAARARTSAEVRGLAGDSDARVARAAQELTR